MEEEKRHGGSGEGNFFLLSRGGGRWDFFAAEDLAPGLVPFKSRKTACTFSNSHPELCVMIGTASREMLKSGNDVMGSDVHCN